MESSHNLDVAKLFRERERDYGAELQMYDEEIAQKQQLRKDIQLLLISPLSQIMGHTVLIEGVPEDMPEALRDIEVFDEEPMYITFAGSQHYEDPSEGEYYVVVARFEYQGVQYPLRFDPTDENVHIRYITSENNVVADKRSTIG